MLIQRFNFFIVFFGVILVGAATTSEKPIRCVLLAAGLIVTLQIAATLRRAQQKFEIAFDHLKAFGDHAAGLSENEVGRKGSKRGWISGLIPWTCIAILAVWLAFEIRPFICKA
ncbi:MAG: hypothetical protein KF691_13100 [Phycisphaeraceae bacterium]|nr:hypothetical protein [Phycisphaeraceae bacterium]